MARIDIGILLTKSEWSELVFYLCPKVDNAQPGGIARPSAKGKLDFDPSLSGFWP